MCCHGSSCCGSPGGPALDRRRVLLGLASACAAPVLPGCDWAVSLVVPTREVERLGLEAWAQTRARLPLSSNAGIQRTARAIAERLSRAQDIDPSTVEVAVFASPQVNAFVLPGRKIGIYEGIVNVSRSEGELAAVVGHEIGHLDANHPQERVATQLATQVGVDLASRALNLQDMAFGREIAAALGLGVEYGIARPYGRSQELEADRLGLTMMARAGYDPFDAVRFWQRMDELPRRGLPSVLSTHPAPAARIEELQDLASDLAQSTPRVGDR